MRSRFKSCGKGISNYVVTFFNDTTLHGFRHVVAPKRHWIEVVLWCCALIGAVIGAAILILISYGRYAANPTVITLSKQYRSWNITLPATTFCLLDKFDVEKGKALVKSKWGVEEGDDKFNYYMEFLKIVANSSYHSLKAFANFAEDPVLEKENLTVLMHQVNFDPLRQDDGLKLTINNIKYFELEPESNIKPINYIESMLEMGICYTVGSLVTFPFTSKNVNDTEVFEPVYCLVLSAICYGMIEYLPRDLEFYIHSPYEVADASSTSYSVANGSQRESRFYHLDILAHSRLRDLRPRQRRCYFYDEPQYNGVKYYSFNLCKIECRKKLAIKLCQCLPHFYTRQGDEKQCTPKQLLCISNYSDYLVDMTERKGKEGKKVKICSCYQACEEVNYYLDGEDVTPNEIASIKITKYRWGINQFSKTRYRRDIIFGFEDLLVSFGGTAGFCLGCSLMSGVELVYFFTLRFIRYVRRSKKDKKAKKSLSDFAKIARLKKISNIWKEYRQDSFEIVRKRQVQQINDLYQNYYHNYYY